jgi:hypothetical protein
MVRFACKACPPTAVTLLALFRVSRNTARTEHWQMMKFFDVPTWETVKAIYPVCFALTHPFAESAHVLSDSRIQNPES